MMKVTRLPLPSARSEGLLIKELPDEVLVYDLESHKAHCLNEAAALIWKQCDGHTTVKQLAGILQTRYETSVDEDVVRFGLDQLGKAKLLEERSNVARQGAPGMSRRQLISRVGLAAVLAVPLITSIVAPTALAGTSCVGKPCLVNSDCTAIGCLTCVSLACQ
jgi:hypothetical protein